MNQNYTNCKAMDRLQHKLQEIPSCQGHIGDLNGHHPPDNTKDLLIVTKVFIVSTITIPINMAVYEI